MRAVVVGVALLAACFTMPPRPQGGDQTGDAPAMHDAPPTGDGGSAANIAFVSSIMFAPGAFGSQAGADDSCKGLALAGGLPGNFIAWLATSTQGASVRLVGARGWVRPDGQPVADTVDDIVAGRLFNPISVDDGMVDHSGDPNSIVETGANADGTAALTCSDYSTTAPGAQITCGIASTTTISWTTGVVAACSAGQRFYCFDISHSTQVTPPAIQPGAKLVFVTTGTFSIGNNTRLAIADQLCASEATAARLTGTFVALLATSTATAASRAPGTYVRPDGIPIGTIGAAIPTPINVTASGVYINGTVWTGAGLATSLGSTTTTCGDWQQGNQEGTVGETAAGGVYFGAATEECTAANHLYCVQQ